MREAPIIVIGMHRSGTSLLSRILQQSGVFMGAKLDMNDESVFFRDVNHWILKQASATWDDPYNFRYVNKEIVNKISSIIVKNIENKYSSYKYFGFPKFMFNSITNVSGMWGWKDPRNSFTVPVWRKLFPNAKILFIHRNPIDVCLSMSKRENMKLSNWVQSKSFGIKTSLYKGTASNTSFKLLDSKNTFDLWSQYNESCLNQNPDFVIKYEDLLSSPDDEILKLWQFLSIKDDKNVLSNISQGLDASRAYAFEKESMEVIQFHDLFRDDVLVKQLGYTNLV